MKLPRRPAPHRAAPVVAATALALLVAGCSGSTSPASDPSTPSPPATSPWAGSSSPSACTDGGSGVDVVPLAQRTGAPGKASWAPWPSALHDARHSGSSTAAGPSKGEEVWWRRLGSGPLTAVAWRAEPGDGLVEGSPGLSADGISLLGTNGQHERAYEHDGERLFTLDLGASTSSCPALTGDGGLLIGTDDGDLVLVR